MAGFPSQATPREINFFYIGEHLRERIIEENGIYKVVNTDLTFSPAEMEAEIEKHLERFSPNVIMRPIYQELILPNLAYIGGGGELAYWLERQTQFEHFGINFPMLVRRNSALWIDANSAKRMEKLGLSIKELWEDFDSLVKIYLKKNAEEEFQLNGEREKLEAIFHQVAKKTESIDPTLVKTVWAEHAKALKSIEHLEVRLVRAEKQKHENAISQIRSLKEKLFPGNGLQERYDNFLAYYLRYGDDFFKVLKDNFDPLEKKFVIIKEAV
jgi:bacillithiol biosynthesis cysteine-adding enzyme BshC